MNFITLLVLSFLHTSAIVKDDTIPNYPQNYFQSPLDIPLSLAGNFGEPRRAHFHTGLDFKTDAREGLKVYAVADGYVSRVGVSAGGYGNALYITHPNGYTSVYGHLQKFNETITALIRKEQYAKESFAVDLNLKPNVLVIKKGDVVALSGNTGGSGGPHLHFEFRDSLERPINPLLFGYKLRDNIAPIMSAVQFYAMDEQKLSASNYRVTITGKAGDYNTSPSNIALNAKKIGVSINTFDRMEGTTSSLGIYSLSMTENEREVYHFSLKRFSFPEKRYVLSQVDYTVFLKEGNKSFHKCFLDPANRLSCYEKIVDNGLLDISDGKIHQLKITATDFAGNNSIVNFSVQFDPNATAFKNKTNNSTQLLDWQKENTFTANDIKLHMPIGCLFDSLWLDFSSTSPSDPSAISRLYTFNRNTDQLFDFFNISIQPFGIAANLTDKALIVWKDVNGAIVSKGGKMEGKFITAKTRELGAYFVKLDTTAPKITPLNISNLKVLPPVNIILIKIADNLSGIEDYRAYVDGKWQLMEYDGKATLLKMNLLDKNIAAGKHSFKLIVTDERKNKAIYESDFLKK